MFFSLTVLLYFTIHWMVELSKLYHPDKGNYTMNPEIVNIYIEKLLNEVVEGTKSRILLETQLKYTEKLNADLLLQLNQLQVQQEKQNKRINKTKEVNTSDTF